MTDATEISILRAWTRGHSSDILPGVIRYLRHAVLLSAILLATSIFLPFVQLSAGGLSLGKSTKLRLYDASSNYGMLAGYAEKADAPMARRIADALVTQLEGRASRLRNLLNDARETADDVKEAKEEAEAIALGEKLMIAGIIFLALLLLVGWFTMQSLSAKVERVWRQNTVLVFALLSGAAAVGIFLSVREGVALANEELDLSVVTIGLAYGAYIMLFAGGTMLIAGIALRVLEWRASRRAPAMVEFSHDAPSPPAN